MKVTGLRLNYFLLKKSPGIYPVTNDPRVFNIKGNSIGTFRILENTKKMYLCIFEADPKLLDENCFIKSFFKTGSGKAVNKKMEDTTPSALSSLYFSGYKFIRKNRNYYGIEKPFPVSSLKDISYHGINSFISEIRKLAKSRYEPAILTPEEMIQFGYTSPNRLLLGISRGRIAMVYLKNGKLLTSFLTESTIKAFKNELFLPLILKIL